MTGVGNSFLVNHNFALLRLEKVCGFCLDNKQQNACGGALAPRDGIDTSALANCM
jgi:hypothetical protein